MNICDIIFCCFLNIKSGLQTKSLLLLNTVDQMRFGFFFTNKSNISSDCAQQGCFTLKQQMHSYKQNVNCTALQFFASAQINNDNK